MSPYMQIHWTAANREEAERIAQLLVERHLVACVHIEAEVESLFFWNGTIEQAREIKVVCKTRSALFSAIEATIIKECCYEIPEILGFAIDVGLSDYLDWIDKATAVPAIN